MLTRHSSRRLLTALTAFALGLTALDAQGPRRIPLGDWPELRGPQRDGVSREVGLPEKLDLTTGSLLWRAPFGGRSTPIVVGNRVFSGVRSYPHVTTSRLHGQ